jgi:hypothetical protein
MRRIMPDILAFVAESPDHKWRFVIHQDFFDETDLFVSIAPVEAQAEVVGLGLTFNDLQRLVTWGQNVLAQQREEDHGA